MKCMKIELKLHNITYYQISHERLCLTSIQSGLKGEKKKKKKSLKTIESCLIRRGCCSALITGRVPVKRAVVKCFV